MTATLETVQTSAGTDVPYDHSFPLCFQYVSPSQFKTSRECLRKWFFQRVRRISVPQTRAMARGKGVHSKLEVYGQTGLEPDISERDGDIAYGALQHLPDWSHDWRVEVNIAGRLRCAGVPVVGFIDLAIPPRGELPPRVVDYKTTKDLRYVKSEAELRHDPQVIIYARWAFEEYFGEDWASGPARVVHVQFVYLLTKTLRAGEARSVSVDFHLTAAEVLEQWAQLESETLVLLDLARRADELHDEQVTANINSCGAWGGCPHRARCDDLKWAAVRRLGATPAIVPVENLTRKGDAMSFDDLFNPKAPEVPNTPAPRAVGTLNPQTSEARPLALFIDVQPVRGEDVLTAQLLEDAIAPHCARVVADWNAANTGAPVVDIQQIDFGKWRGPLRAELTRDPPTGCVLARGYGDLSNCAIEALRPLASVVLQGVR